MKEELYIIVNGGRRALDLPKPSGITLKWVSNLFSDLSKMTCSYSYTFKLPMTTRNRVAFDLADDVRYNSAFRGRRIDAEFLMNGVNICPNANLYISETDKTNFSCVMTWGVLKGFQKLKESTLKLNELGNLGSIFWKDDDTTLQYGKPTRGLSNMDDLVYPDYDAGCPHYAGTPPKPCMPVYRLIQLINEKFGVKFSIGRLLEADFGVMPLANFNNRNYHGGYVYDDYVTNGVVPLVNTNIDSSEQVVEGVIQIDSFTMKRLDESGTRKWRIAHAITREGGMLVNIYSTIGIEEGESLTGIEDEIVGIPRFINFPETGAVKRLCAETYSDVGKEAVARYGDSTYYEYWTKNGYYFQEEIVELSFHDIAYTKFSTKGKGSYGEEYQVNMPNCIGFSCNEAVEMYGTLKLHLTRDAVENGRVSLDEYRWITLALVKSTGTTADLDKKYSTGTNRFVWSWGGKEADIEYVSEKDPDRWLGLLSVTSYTYDDETDTYVYEFDFGDIYPVRRLQLDSTEVGDEQVGGYFFIPYYPEDEMETVTVTDEDGNEEKKERLKLREGDIYISDMRISKITPELKFYGLPAHMDIIKNLPNMSCFEFMKAVYYMNGAMPILDKDGETITAMFYNELRDKVYEGVAVDWSKKLSGYRNRQSEKIKFASNSFAKRNYYQMAYSTKDMTEQEKNDELDVFDTGYGSIDIDNATLDDTKNIYKSPFYPGIMQDRQFPLTIVGRTTKIWNGMGEYTTEARPIYGLLVYRSLNNEFEDVSDVSRRYSQSKMGAEFKQIRMNAFNPFKDMSDVFGYLQDIMSRFVIVKEELMLTELDILALDFSMPVYLEKYNSFFAISTLQRDNKGVFKAELIKLPYVKPEYQTVEDDYIKDEEEIIIDPDEGKPIVTGYTMASGVMTVKLELHRTYTTNPCPICYDYWVNNQYEVWSTTHNTLSLPISGEYMSRFIYPYNDNWDENRYKVHFYVPNKVSYKVVKTRGSKTISTVTLTTDVLIYLDDVKLSTGWHEKMFTKDDDGKYLVFKIIYGIYDTDGTLIEQVRKKVYYFVYTLDRSVINDSWDEEQEDVAVSGLTVSGSEVIYGVGKRDYTVYFTPSYATIRPTGITVTSNSERLEVSDIRLTGFSLKALSLPDSAEEAVISIKASMPDGSSFSRTYKVTLRKPVLNIKGEDSFGVPNGTGEASYTVYALPVVDFTITSVTSSNRDITATVDGNGFKLSTYRLSANATTTVIVQGEYDGVQMEVRKTVTVVVDASTDDKLDLNGALIVDINGVYYTKDEWLASGLSNDKAEGVAVSDGTHRFVMAKEDSTSPGSELYFGGYGITIDGIQGVNYDGYENTQKIIAAVTGSDGKYKTSPYSAAAYASQKYPFMSGRKGYLGSAGEWSIVKDKFALVQELLGVVGKKFTSGYYATSYWTSNISNETGGSDYAYMFVSKNGDAYMSSGHRREVKAAVRVFRKI